MSVLFKFPLISWVSFGGEDFAQGCGVAFLAVYTVIVYTIYGMKNVTLSADERLIEQARLVARSQHKTLNLAFREWLEQYAAQAGAGAAVDALMRRLKHIRSAGPYTRDQMNER